MPIRSGPFTEAETSARLTLTLTPRVRLAQRLGGTEGALAPTHSRENQREDREHVREEREQLRREPVLQTERESEESAEQQPGTDRTKRVPGGENGQRQGDPAQAVGHLLAPGGPVGERQVSTNSSRHATTEGDGEVAEERDAPPGRVGRGGRLAHRAQDEPEACPVEEEPEEHRDGQDQVGEDVLVAEERRPDERNLREERHIEALEGAEQGPAHPAAAKEARESQSEDGDGQTRDVLVGAQGDGDEGVEPTQRPADAGRGEGADAARAAALRGHEADQRTEDHHPLDAQIDDRGAFSKDLAYRGPDAGRAEGEGAGDGGDENA